MNIKRLKRTNAWQHPCWYYTLRDEFKPMQVKEIQIHQFKNNRFIIYVTCGWEYQQLKMASTFKEAKVIAKEVLFSYLPLITKTQT